MTQAGFSRPLVLKAKDSAEVGGTSVFYQRFICILSFGEMQHI